MTNDILDELRRFRPDDRELERRWPAESRDRLADAIRRDERDATVRWRLPASRRARIGAATTLVAAAVAAALAVPALLPAGAPGSADPAAAAALHRLARVAANTSVDIAEPDQFVHLVERNRQYGTFEGSYPTPTLLVTTYESWTGSHGQSWRRQTVPGTPGSTTEFYPAHDGDESYLASLPTDPDRLEDFLRSHASGSDSVDEAVFTSVGDLLRGGNVNARLRSAAVAVLARTDHLSLGPVKTDRYGRPVEEFDFVDNSLRPGEVESLFFDPHTAALLDERTTTPDRDDTVSVLRTDVVDSVPPDVVRTAVRQK